MARIQAPRRVRIEDFGPEERKVIERLSETINTFNEDVYNTLSNGVDFDNLNQQLVDVIVQIDAGGEIANEPRFTTTVRGRIRGVIVVRAENIENPNVFPTAAPFISYASNGNLVTILNVTGLPNSSSYRLTLLILP
jgi:hypothetical protein